MIDASTPTRRQLLTAIGKAGGGAALYHAMTALGHAAPTSFEGPPKLDGTRKGASVIVLGAGLAGMASAYELAKAGYKVTILEYQDRPGGRNWTLRGGDTYTEIGGATQKVGFAPGNYLNPGPWRIPYHHRALLHYCQQFGVALEPFVQLNNNAYLHHSDAYGGKPQRYAEVAVDFKGHVSELLAKALNRNALDDTVGKEDRERLLEALRAWGVLDKDMTYKASLSVSSQRGYESPPGGGVGGAPTPSKVNGLNDVLDSNVWANMNFYFTKVMQQSMFQPTGGMDMIGKAFARQLPNMITYGAKVTKIAQGSGGVTVDYQDVASGARRQAKADWCVCTIPLPVLSQIDVQVSDAKQTAMQSVPYHSSCKIGLEMKRRFWEQDDYIYGGHSFTSGSISLISYPQYKIFDDGPGVLLGCYAGGAKAYEFAGMTPAERIERALAEGEAIHPQYRREFSNGVSVAWSRVPWIAACASTWSPEIRQEHYQNLVSLDGRVVLAGEHCSYIGAWMEAALLSAIDAVTRLHKAAQEA